MSAHLLMKRLSSSRCIWDNITTQPTHAIAYFATSFSQTTSSTWSTWIKIMDCRYGKTDAENNQNLGILHSQQVFCGVLKTYDIPVAEHERDLLSFIWSKSDEIQNVVQLNTQNHAQKLQFSALVPLTKPSTDENVSSQPDRIRIYIISKMQRVDFTVLSISCFTGMVEQRLLALNNFASHGSGWAVDRIENIEMRLGSSKPIAASPYLTLPSDKKPVPVECSQPSRREMFSLLLYSSIS